MDNEPLIGREDMEPASAFARLDKTHFRDKIGLLFVDSPEVMAPLDGNFSLAFWVDGQYLFRSVFSKGVADLAFPLLRHLVRSSTDSHVI